MWKLYGGLTWLLLWSLAGGACVYDHRVVQAIQARRKRAKQAEAARITSRHGGPVRIEYRARLRVYVSEGYRRTHGRWRDDVSDWTEAAAAFVGPEYGLAFESVDVRPWQADCDPESLPDCLRALAETDGGADAHWVVGLLGATPKYTNQFHDLGVARPLGRHFILRDLSDPAETTAIAKAFPTHTASRRAEILKKRRVHKRLAILLHEWGHTLGALHTRRKDGLLAPAYNGDMRAFSDANDGLIRASLEDRFSTQGGHSGLLAYLAQTEDDQWSARERQALVDHLRSATEAPVPAGAAAAPSTPASEASAHPFVVPGKTEQLLEAAVDEDRARYEQAVTLTVKGAYGDAATALIPLLTRYPECFAVQHLGCGLLMSIGDSQRAQQACQRAQALTPPG